MKLFVSFFHAHEKDVNNTFAFGNAVLNNINREPQTADEIAFLEQAIKKEIPMEEGETSYISIVNWKVLKDPENDQVN